MGECTFAALSRRVSSEALSRSSFASFRAHLFPFAETPQVNSLINVFKACLNAAHMYVIYT